MDLSDWEDQQRHAVYSHFRVGPEIDKYMLYLNEYIASESTVGDSLMHHIGMYFSPKDQDNVDSSGYMVRRRYEVVVPNACKGTPESSK